MPRAFFVRPWLFVWPFFTGLAAASFSGGSTLCWGVVIGMEWAGSPGRAVRVALLLGVIWGSAMLPPAWKGLSWDAFMWRQPQGVGRIVTQDASWAAQARAWGTGRFRRALPPREAGLAAAMLYGDASFSSVDRTRIRAAGISHIVAVSGANILFLLVLARTVLGRLGLRTLRWRIWADMAVTLGIVVLTGASASVVRAGTMLVLLSGARLRRRRSSFARLLLISAFALVVLDPRRLLFDAGFQLSFLACIGLLHAQTDTSAQGLLERLEWRTSRYAFLWTAPFQFWCFGGLTWIALASNLFALFVVPWIQALAVCVVLAPSFGPAVRALGALLGYVWLIIDLASAHPFAWSVSAPGAFMLMAFGYLALVIHLIHKNARSWGSYPSAFFDGSWRERSEALLRVAASVPGILDGCPDLAMRAWFSMLGSSAKQ